MSSRASPEHKLRLVEALQPRGEVDIMRRQPRIPVEPLLSRFLMWPMVLVSSLLVAGSLGLFL